MRTRDQILEKLKNSLNTPIWQNLKRGLLGRELLEYGATVIHNNELVYDQFYRNLFPDTANLKGCVYIGYAHEVPFSDFVPAYIKVLMPLDGGRSHPPFSIVLSAGGLNYTNIEFIRTGKSRTPVTLYQGNVKCSTDAPLLNMGFTNVDPVPLVNYHIDLDKTENGQYFKLGKKVIPSSVHAFYTEPTVQVLTPMTPLNQNPETDNYRLMKGNDLSLNLYLSDGVRGRAYDQRALAIYYLEATFNKYKNERRLLNTIYAVDINIEESDVLSEFSGESASIQNARDTLKAELSKDSVIATKDQIKSYLNSHPTVVDSNTVRGKEINKVISYIKPRTIGDTYQDILEGLRSHGEIVTSYEIKEGVGVNVSVILRSLELTEEEKSKVSTKNKD